MSIKPALNYLVIGDLHLPMEHPKALAHCQWAFDEFKIPGCNVLSTGDFTDNYFAGLYKHSPNADMTPSDELEYAQKKIRDWSRAFPRMRIAQGNHDLRWSKKLFDSGIPDVVMRQFKELLGLPKGWELAKKHLVKSKNSFIVEHGHPATGMNAHREKALLNGCNTIIGHTHAHAGISFINSGHQRIWGANAGCLIDAEHWAFHYGIDCKHKPCIGVMVVLDSGRCPLWLPL